MPTTLLLGASRGIGLELARQAVAAGERVIATARSDDGLATLRELGCQVLKLDVANPASVSGLAWQLDGEKIDTAWHVAGVMCSRADATQPPTQQDFDRVMHANVLGAMQVIPQVAPLVEAAQGRFAFLSSVMGQIGGAAGSNAWPSREQGGAEHGRGLGAACVPAGHLRVPAPRLGADRHGRWRGARGGARQRCRPAPRGRRAHPGRQWRVHPVRRTTLFFMVKK